MTLSSRLPGGRRALGALALLLLALGCATSPSTSKSPSTKDPFEKFVWPRPPNPARIRLSGIWANRIDVEGESGLSKALIAQSDMSPLDFLIKPFAVDFDREGRILVTDPQKAALFRIDRAGHRWDVAGTTTTPRLKVPLGLAVGPDGRIYVADSGVGQIVVFDPEMEEIVATLGTPGRELQRPTDVAISRDGLSAFVVDSSLHKVLRFDLRSGKQAGSIGTRGTGDGEFNFPVALATDPDGNLFVIDSMNSRLQIFSPDGTYLDQFGSLSTTFGGFVRPKDVAIDDRGFIYVTDAAFNNIQIFSPELDLLTFVGQGGTDLDSMNLPVGVKVRGDEIAVVDQIRGRILVFRYIVSPTEK